jgi:hypothetical protein
VSAIGSGGAAPRGVVKNVREACSNSDILLRRGGGASKRGLGRPFWRRKRGILEGTRGGWGLVERLWRAIGGVKK